MIFKQIVKDATVKQRETSFVFEGTNISQVGDILADIFLLLPKRTPVGFVSRGVWEQANKIYTDYKDVMLSQPYLHLSGHSLGGGSALLVLVFLLLDNYQGDIFLQTVGAVKPISKRVALWIETQDKLRCKQGVQTKIAWRIRYRDPVPYLGFWSTPIKEVRYEGTPRKHFLDFSMDEHVAY